MRAPISLKFILSSAIVAWGLVAGQLVEKAVAQTQQFQQPANVNTSTSPANTPTDSVLPPDIDPNGPLAQVIRLVQAGVEQSVILTYINNVTNLFNLSSDDIIYLNDLGVPAEAINAMMQRDQQLQQMGFTATPQPTQPAFTTETAPAQPTEVTVNYFYNTLAPYGAWVNLNGYGWCWRPTVVIYSPGWQPYCNNGYWVYTDCGWYWVSGYSWGWATFHYGRWFYNPRYGWCWWPNTAWAPSWVCWRYNRNYCGWAPLPPYAAYQPGVGFIYHGSTVSAGFSFGLTASAFTFVPTKDFCNRQPWHYRVNEREVPRVYNETKAMNNIYFDRRHQNFANAGIPPQNITAVTRQHIRPVTIRSESGSLARGLRREQFENDGRTLIVHRPRFVGSPVLTLHQRPGTAPAIDHRQNKYHPNVRSYQNNLSPRPGYPAQNNYQHSEINRNPNHNFNYVRPQTPPTRQYVIPHGATPYPQAHNNVMAAPPGNYSTRPAQHQPPNRNYGSNNRFLSPRALGNAIVQQPRSRPPASHHYSPPTAAPQSNYRHSQQASGHNDRAFSHSESRPQPVQPHPPHQSSSPSSSQQSGRHGHGNGSNQRGH